MWFSKVFSVTLFFCFVSGFPYEIESQGNDDFWLETLTGSLIKLNSMYQDKLNESTHVKAMKLLNLSLMEQRRSCSEEKMGREFQTKLTEIFESFVHTLSKLTELSRPKDNKVSPGSYDGRIDANSLWSTVYHCINILSECISFDAPWTIEDTLNVMSIYIKEFVKRMIHYHKLIHESYVCFHFQTNCSDMSVQKMTIFQGLLHPLVPIADSCPFSPSHEVRRCILGNIKDCSDAGQKAMEVILSPIESNSLRCNESDDL